MPKYLDPCPSWFSEGPHSWATGVPGQYSDTCSGCGISRKAARLRAKLLRLPHGVVVVKQTPSKRLTKLRLVVNNR
jgi:hypothetical protein